MAEQKPIHYFVYSKGSDSLGLTNATEDNTIVKYFDSEEDVDLTKFAEIVKNKPNCVRKHFIVNKGDEYRAVETDNVKNTYVFSGRLKYRIVSKLAAGTATIDTFIEEDKRLEEGFAKPERQPGFKLRDTNGEIIPDGITFALQILRGREEESDEEDEEETEGLSKDELLYRNKDWVGVNSFMNDGKDHFLCGQVDGGDSFECETIDNIVYLKYDGGYFYFDNDGETNDIFIGKAVPTKEQRVQIHYSDDGDICLTGWGGRVYVACEWVKCSYGAIGLDDREEQLRWGSPMKLRIIRL
ncbi:hypothetical protein IW147_004495 [Coemansia sp. RSA 720]|nr:hypothetical protein LPJ76_006166 [Coemansia sp. RSA 638]KAJ2121193.1 hypothetical protein IW147_004495 [Coemansia sp. RSA 720]KAJ2538249.1 hypothetical protein GGF49_006030 [Coemansia sp. RSA 1853]